MTQPIKYSEIELEYKSWLMLSERLSEEQALKHVRTLHKMKGAGIDDKTILANHPMKLIIYLEGVRGGAYRPAYRADLQQSIGRYQNYLNNKGASA